MDKVRINIPDLALEDLATEKRRKADLLGEATSRTIPPIVPVIVSDVAQGSTQIWPSFSQPIAKTRNKVFQFLCLFPLPSFYRRSLLHLHMSSDQSPCPAVWLHLEPAGHRKFEHSRTTCQIQLCLSPVSEFAFRNSSASMTLLDLLMGLPLRTE
jgi:hypothetical protein